MMKQQALKLLSKREHSSYELQTKLMAKGHPLQSILSLLKELQSEGYLSDLRFTQCYIYSRSERGYGPLRIAVELKARGVSDENIKACLNYADPQWQEVLAKLKSKRLAALASQDPKEILRYQHFLRYRGFTSEQIKVSLAD